MSRCWLEGELRAHLDCELPARDMGAIERHLKECAACAALAGELNRRAARVGALMEALEEIPEARVVAAAAPEAPRWRRHAIVVGLLAAACGAMALVLPKRQAPVVPPRRPVVELAQPKPTVPLRPRLGATAPLRAVARRRQPSQPQYYIALDDEPLDSGVVVRVTLPDTGLLADVIYDEQGRPRAVRPLN
jgi:hypothetical protein